jgi:hypothetical protein
MISEVVGSTGGTLGITLLVSVFTLLGTIVPFLRGLRVFLQAVAATRRVDPRELEAPTRSPERTVEPLGLLLLRVIRKSLRAGGDSHPIDFVVDASRQFVMHEYDSNYAQRISMYANILPPIGFIGTTTGLFVLFLSMRVASESLELSALALALTSSIFALLGFAVLEGLKIYLYGRLLDSLSHALVLQRSAGRRPAEPAERADPAGRAAVAAR